jgi:hypothetical protein
MAELDVGAPFRAVEHWMVMLDGIEQQYREAVDELIKTRDRRNALKQAIAGLQRVLEVYEEIPS